MTVADDAHETISPAILYFGTPVVLVSTVNADGSDNLAPISSVFWLGDRAVIGIGARSQTARNLARVGEVVLNLPSVDQAGAVDRLALTTGASPVPPSKVARGYVHVADKFARAGLTPVRAHTVLAARAAECPVHLEGTVVAAHAVGGDDVRPGGVRAVEIRVTRVHVHRDLRLAGHPHRVDPDRWRPLLMSFQQFYGLGPRVRASTLAGIDEELYR